MEKAIADWLLEGPTWLRYAVELQLLNKKPDPEQVVSDVSITEIISELKGVHGVPAIKTGAVSYKGNVYWDLFFLADIGLTINDIRFEQEAKSIYNLQSPDGTFTIMDGTRSSYFCIPTMLLSTLKKMGYSEKEKLQKFIQLIFQTQRLDGGWHCAQQRAVGHRLQDSESCPMDNLNILMLLGQFKEYREDTKLHGALDLLLTHWDRRDEKWRPYGFGIGTDFKKLKYPAITYGILRVLDALSCFPYAVEHPSFESMMEEVRGKSQNGKYYAESVVKHFSQFDFGQKKEPSRWITFLMNRVEKRLTSLD